MGNSKNTNNATGNVVSELKVFDNEQFGSTRVVLINDEPWFIGKDIASALGYENGSRDTKRHVDAEDRRVEMLPQYQNGTLVSKVLLINESGLYSLILSSKLPKAKEFKRWVTSEILPSIRKYGGYIDQKEGDTEEDILKKWFLLACITMGIQQRDLAEKIKLLEQKDEMLAVQAPKVMYHDTVLRHPGAICPSILAKDYGITVVEFNLLLHRMGIQFKRSNGKGKTWLLYKKYANKNYVLTKTEIQDGEEVYVITHFTHEGRMWLYYLLKECGIVPIHEKYPGLTPAPPSRDELSLALAKHHTKGKSEAEILFRQYRQILQDIKAMEQLEIDSVDEMEKVQQEMEEGRKRLSLMEWLVEGLQSSKDGNCAYWVIYCSFMDGSQPSGLYDILERIAENCTCVDRSTYYRVRSKALDELNKIMSISFLGKNQSLLNIESCTASELLEAYRMACRMAVAPTFLGLKNELFTEQKRLAEELVDSLLEQKQQGEYWVLRCTFMSDPEPTTEEEIISLIAEVHKKYDRSSYYRIRTKAIKRVEVLLDERRKVI